MAFSLPLAAFLTGFVALGSTSGKTPNSDQEAESALTNVLNRLSDSGGIVLIDDYQPDRLYHEASNTVGISSNLKGYFNANSYYSIISRKNVNYILPKEHSDRSGFLLKKIGAIDCDHFKYDQMIQLLGDLAGYKLYSGNPSFNARTCLYSIHSKDVAAVDVLAAMAEQAKTHQIYVTYPLAPNGEISDRDVPLITIQ